MSTKACPPRAKPRHTERGTFHFSRTHTVVSSCVNPAMNRYAIGSGKHVLWRRMVREVPELMGRTPQEARERWLRLTGRLSAGGGGGGSGREGGEAVAGSPALDNFYVQVGLNGSQAVIHSVVLIAGQGITLLAIPRIPALPLVVRSSCAVVPHGCTRRLNSFDLPHPPALKTPVGQHNTASRPGAMGGNRRRRGNGFFPRKRVWAARLGRRDGDDHSADRHFWQENTRPGTTVFYQSKACGDRGHFCTIPIQRNIYAYNVYFSIYVDT